MRLGVAPYMQFPRQPWEPRRLKKIFLRSPAGAAEDPASGWPGQQAAQRPMPRKHGRGIPGHGPLRGLLPRPPTAIVQGHSSSSTSTEPRHAAVRPRGRNAREGPRAIASIRPGPPPRSATASRAAAVPARNPPDARAAAPGMIRREGSDPVVWCPAGTVCFAREVRRMDPLHVIQAMAAPAIFFSGGGLLVLSLNARLIAIFARCGGYTTRRKRPAVRRLLAALHRRPDHPQCVRGHALRCDFRLDHVVLALALARSGRGSTRSGVVTMAAGLVAVAVGIWVLCRRILAAVPSLEMSRGAARRDPEMPEPRATRTDWV